MRYPQNYLLQQRTDHCRIGCHRSIRPLLRILEWAVVLYFVHVCERLMCHVLAVAMVAVAAEMILVLYSHCSIPVFVERMVPMTE